MSLGIARDVWMDAAQDAAPWRARLRRGWRRNPGGNGDSDASVDGGDDGGNDWPRRVDFPRNCRRAVRVLRCECCTYRTHHAAWLAAHVKRLHPTQSEPRVARTLRQGAASKARRRAAAAARPVGAAAHPQQVR